MRLSRALDVLAIEPSPNHTYYLTHNSGGGMALNLTQPENQATVVVAAIVVFL